MKITIEVDENELQKAVVDIVAKESVRSYFKCDKSKGVEKAVKEVIYSQKEELIERCVNRASAELKRKALPELMKMLSED